MQFERLKKSHKKEILVALITICVIGVVFTFATSRAFYRVDDSIDLAKGTINYKVYDFKIMAMYKSDDKTNYIEIEEMPSEGYTINESKSYCNMSDGNKDTTAILKTIDGNHIISKLKKNDKCFIYFDKKELTSEDTLVKLNITNIKNETPDFSQIATTDEGIFKVEDGMYGGYSYYWRGAVTNNYVKFANFCWRIVRINGDGSIRLIYDGTTCHANGTSTAESIAVTGQAYNPSFNRSEYVGWTYSTGNQRTTGGSASNIKSQTDSWFNANITETNAEKVADGKFCNDRNTQSGYSWSSQPSSTFYYAARGRLDSAKTPTLECPSGDVYTLKAGAITADEVAFAGGTAQDNKKYYLYNGQSYWTMTPQYWYYYKVSDFYAIVFAVLSSGHLNGNRVDNNNNNLRPVINLRSDITFSGGNGTINSPYVVN